MQANLLTRLYKLQSLRGEIREGERLQIVKDFDLNGDDVINWFRPALKDLKTEVRLKDGKPGYRNIRTIKQMMELYEKIQAHPPVDELDYKDSAISKLVPYEVFAGIKPVERTLGYYLDNRNLKINLGVDVTADDLAMLYDKKILTQDKTDKDSLFYKVGQKATMFDYSGDDTDSD